MTPPFQRDIQHLNECLLTMASKAESAVTTATRALLERNDELAAQVEETDHEIDRIELEIDELAIQLLSKAPLARDLRFITVAMKICTDLERVGDEATTMARRTLKLSQESQLKHYVDIPRMVESAMAMMDQALKAFVNEDAESARAVITQDKDVDGLNRKLQSELREFMEKDPGTISKCLHLMVISKSIERIADHAKNIAEVVVYLCEATDIRHEKSGHGKEFPINAIL